MLNRARRRQRGQQRKCSGKTTSNGPATVTPRPEALTALRKHCGLWGSRSGSLAFGEFPNATLPTNFPARKVSLIADLVGKRREAVGKQKIAASRLVVRGWEGWEPKSTKVLYERDKKPSAYYTGHCRI